ncbi:MAG TPA: sulfite exporter TauE/SafE family protein [Burkholderiales bacterium]|nr:sulfite exporter TauE/SafE family protein [Burkholderiales bacterium]
MEFAPSSWALPLALLVTGFLSGVHCVGMCGGIVCAFSPNGGGLRRQLAFNFGRITSYAAVGAGAGLIGSAGAWAAGAAPAQAALYVLANAMLVLVGLHLAGAGRLLGGIEALGAPLWRRLQPLAARLLPAQRPSQAYAAGLVWGWLPCGLVYGALAAAAFAGGPAAGALAMLAFGLGTLPNLLAAGLAAARLRAFTARRAVRLAAGALVFGFGAVGLAQAAGIAGGLRNSLLCL